MISPKSKSKSSVIIASVVIVFALFLLSTVWKTRAQTGTPLVFDSFTGADNTSLMSHGPDLNAAGAPWILSGSIDPGQWGLSTDIPVAGDYDGDGKFDPAFFRPSTGLWANLKSSTNYTTAFSVSWGLSTDIPVPGDYDGDGKTDPAVYRAALSGAGWYFLKSSTNYASSGAVTLGLNPGDIPVPGDYDGDHKTDPAVYSPSTGTWSFSKSSTNYVSSAQYSWGVATDKPAPGDYDGDGKVDPAIYRPSNGLWAILKSSTNYTTSAYATLGVSTDNPAPADYDGDGKSDPAVQRSSTGVWSVLDSSTGYTTRETFEMAAGATTPAQGDYNGDHRADAAFYRPSNGTWRYLASNAIVLTTGEAAARVTGSSWLSATIDARTPNGIISVDYRVPVIGPPFGGIVTRFTDPQNFLFAAHYNGALYLFRIVNGVFTTINYSAVTAAPGSVHRIQVKLTGGLIDVSWDGVSRFTANEFFYQTATRHGIGWNPSYSPSGTYDNFQIIGFDPPQAVHVIVTPATVTMTNTGTQALNASVYDGNDQPVYGIPVTWTTSDAGIADVSATGVVTARAFGVATITATPIMPNDVVTGTSGTATIRVKPPAWLAPDAFTFGNGTSGDALLYNPFSGAYSVQVNSGAGAFSTLATGTWGSGCIVRAGDLNGDGRSDLLRYNPITGQVVRTINQGSGALADYLSTSLAGAVPTLVDFNGDGRTDLFLYNPTTGAWAKGVSSGDGGFTYSTGVWGPHWQVYAADWDGDSLGDLFLYDAGNGLTYKVTSLSDGGFAYYTTPWSAGWEVYPADFNRDGRTDVFLYNRTTGVWMQMLGALSGWVAGSQGQWSPGWTLRVGDFNQDGRSDLFRYNVDTGAWAVRATRADLSFDNFGGSWSPGWGVSMTDFNTDGASDLLLYNSGTGQWAQAVATGPGTFSLASGTWSSGWTVVSRTASLPVATGVEMTPIDVPAITVGTSATLSARPLDSSGVSVGGVPLLWTTSNSAVLTVSASHGQSVQATGQSMGSAIITAATPNGFTAQRSIIVHCGGSTSPASVNLSGDSVNGTIALTSPGCNWLALSDSSWLSVNSSSGSGSGQVGYTVQRNDTATERTGTVTFKGSDGFVFAVFTVNQARWHCTGGTFPATYNSPGAGGYAEITLSAGCNWTAASESGWLHLDHTSGTGDAFVGVTIDPNGGAARTGTVTFKGPEDLAFADFTVTQARDPGSCTGGTFPISPYEFPAEGGTREITLSSLQNCHWTAESNSSWLRLLMTSGDGDAYVGYTVDFNSGPERTGIVTFRGSNTVSFATFTVAQQGGGPGAVTLYRPLVHASVRAGEHLFFGAQTAGDLSRVDFYVDGSLVGTDTTSPYGFMWTGAGPGSHNVTARAIATGGTSTTTNPVEIIVSDSSADRGPELKVAGDRFTVDNQQRQLLFLSYFDGTDVLSSEAQWSEDFEYFASKGVDGIRVLPNWWRDSTSKSDPCSPNPLFTLQGGVNSATMERLQNFLKSASSFGLIVNVTFTRESVCPGNPSEKNTMGVDKYRIAIKETASLLHEFRNVLFDLQNEFNLNGIPEGSTTDPEADMRHIRDDIENVDSSRVVVASTESGFRRPGSDPAVATGDFAQQQMMDAADYHDPRDPNWFEDTVIGDLVCKLRNGMNGNQSCAPRKPIYFSEPKPWGDDQNKDHFLQAWQHATGRGVAAWTFHTRSAHLLNGQRMINLMSPAEKEALVGLKGFAP